jgi:hypothetical protein
MKPILVILAAVALLLPGGASAKEQPAVSATISASTEAVKFAIVARLSEHGFHLESDSPFQMVFAKEMNNAGGVLAQAMIGNANCSMPKQVLSFTFAPQADAVLVVGLEQLDKATVLCARERINMDGKKNREAMASFLADIKSKAEAKAKKE